MQWIGMKLPGYLWSRRRRRRRRQSFNCGDWSVTILVWSSSVQWRGRMGIIFCWSNRIILFIQFLGNIPENFIYSFLIPFLPLSLLLMNITLDILLFMDNNNNSWFLISFFAESLNSYLSSPGIGSSSSRWLATGQHATRLNKSVDIKPEK